MSLRDRIAKFHDVFSRRYVSLGASKPTKELGDATRKNIVMLYVDVRSIPRSTTVDLSSTFPGFLAGSSQCSEIQILQTSALQVHERTKPATS